MADPNLQKGPIIDPNQFKLLIGVGCIIISFIGICGIVYVFKNEGLLKEEQVKLLEDGLNNLESEKDIVELELENMKAQANTIKLNALLAESNKVYGEEELDRKEGLLWVDQETSTFVVTLGALNGLKPGSILGVYDGDSKLGQVVVDVPFDVISYVRPLEQSRNQFDDKYYRVTIE